VRAQIVRLAAAVIALLGRHLVSTEYNK
jgi:hypothetical protein